MVHPKRAIDAIAISQLNCVGLVKYVELIMAPFTEIVRSKAVVNSDTAAEHAFPVNVLFAVSIATFEPSSVHFEMAVLTLEVFFLRDLVHVSLLLTVEHTSEVGSLASVALVESAHFDLLLWDFFLGDEHIDGLADGNQTFELSTDFLAPSLNDLLLALGAIHEIKRDLQSVPPTLQELENALCVVNMSTSKFHTGSSLKLLNGANAALIGGNNVVGTAALLYARHAIGLVPHAMALVTAKVEFIASFNVVIFILRIALGRLNDINSNSWKMLYFFSIVLHQVSCAFALLRVGSSESQLGNHNQMVTLVFFSILVLHFYFRANWINLAQKANQYIVKLANHIISFHHHPNF